MSKVCDRTRFVYGVRVVSGAADIEFQESTGVTTPVVASIPAGIYHTFVDAVPAALSSFGFLSLYDEIETQMNAASANGRTYTVFRIDPDVSNVFAGNSGIGINVSSDEFQLNFSSPGFTLDRRLFGQPFDYAIDELSSGGGFIGDHTAYGNWVSPECPNDFTAWDEYNQCRSGGIAKSRRTNRFETRRLRRIRFDRVPAGLVYEGRNDNVDWFTGASVAQFDSGNYFQSMHREALSRDLYVVAFWEQGEDANDFSNPEGYDVFRLAETRAQDNLAIPVRRARTTAEKYNIEFVAELLTQTTWRF